MTYTLGRHNHLLGAKSIAYLSSVREADMEVREGVVRQVRERWFVVQGCTCRTNNQ